jgi:hypothetical protein
MQLNVLEKTNLEIIKLIFAQTFTASIAHLFAITLLLYGIQMLRLLTNY